jgi:hypothetical protein
MMPASVTFAEPRAELSQYGITWKFQTTAEVGTYVTGDWWVVGPVTITAITPAPTANRHGSVINPAAGDRQSYDHRIPGFDPAPRIKMPLELKPGDSLVSTDSVEKVGDKTPDTVPGHYARGPLRTAAVLTCVAKAPPANAFRPAYVGTWKKPFTTDDLKLDRLPELAAVRPMPKADRLNRYLQRPWLDHLRQYVSRQMHPLENMPDYGRDMTTITGETGLALLVESFRKQHPELLHRYVQLGIDYFGVVQSDNHLWIGNGGHNSGRKLPIIFAGIVLGQDDMKHVKATFAEDDQTYRGRGYAGQMALFSIAKHNVNARHEEVPPSAWPTFGKGKNNGMKAESYRKLNGPTWVATGLTVRLLHAEALWNHPPFLAYVDRWMQEEGAAPKFVKAMWKTYRTKADEGTAK